MRNRNHILTAILLASILTAILLASIALGTISTLSGCVTVVARDQVTIDAITEAIRQAESDKATMIADLRKAGASAQVIRGTELLFDERIEYLRAVLEHEGAKVGGEVGK